jgi:hypothetical protein
MNPSFSTQNWYAMVVESWGEEWGKPDPGYEWSNGRRFNDGHAFYV